MQCFTKKVVWFIIINSVIWIYMSYGLALLNKTDIAETLSVTVVVQLVAVVLGYCVKALLENLSKNNAWPDKPADKPEDKPADTVKRDC